MNDVRSVRPSVSLAAPGAAFREGEPVPLVPAADAPDARTIVVNPDDRDQPLLGRGDGEAYQIGFVDVCDRPYPELCRAARKIGGELYEKRSKGVW